jgi:DNA-directed RNA polymerase I and III subunit RPAC1
MTFEMKGVGPAIANAFRRILLAEVPTMAIEKVFVVNNTSVIPDEVLAHRLGLVPLAVDPSLFEFRNEGDAANEHNTVVMRLAMRCTRGADGEMRNAVVTSGDLEWLPLGSALPEETDAKLTAFSKSQSSLLQAPAEAVHADILLAKMRPGQEIELEAHAVKGKGKTHAKWSPVGTAWYELCPEIVTLEPLHGDEAEAYIAAVHPPEATRERQTCFALSADARRTLRVPNRRGCWYCREKVRTMSGDARWAPYVQLRRIKEHYLFTIESVGQMPPDTLFTEAVDILREKCLRLNVNLE